MFDRDSSFIRYKTEADLLAILEEDRLNPDLPPRCQQRMVVDAASFGWNEAIEYMVDVMGFSADDHDGKDYTPLGFAAMNGHFKTVKMLIEDYGVDVNAHNCEGPHYNGIDWFDGFTALDYALECKHYHVSRFLIENDAEVLEYEDGDITTGDALELVNAELKKQAQRHWRMLRITTHKWKLAWFIMESKLKHSHEPGGLDFERSRNAWEHLGKRRRED